MSALLQKYKQHLHLDQYKAATEIEMIGEKVTQNFHFYTHFMNSQSANIHVGNTVIGRRELNTSLGPIQAIGPTFI